MDIKGRYFAVGHGLTYGFKVDSYNVLFDIRKKNNLTKELSTFYGSKLIHTLIISHFHDDHVAGIKELYKDGFKIKRIYIPYIDDDEKFILKLKKALEKGKRTTFLSIGDDSSESILNDYNIEIVKVKDECKIKTSTTPFWNFNIHQSKGNATAVVARILSELAHIGIITPKDVLDNLEIHYEDIKNAYIKAIKNLNLTCIFMVHGPVNDSDLLESSSQGTEFLSCKTISMKIKQKYYSFISGDCNLSNNKTVITDYVNQLGYALVPHHSGMKEWSDFLCNANKDIQWIVTINEIGSRPYGKIVKDIYRNGSKLFICDKTKSFDYSFFTL